MALADLDPQEADRYLVAAGRTCDKAGLTLADLEKGPARVAACVRACEGVATNVLECLSVAGLLFHVERGARLIRDKYPRINQFPADYSLIDQVYTHLTEPVARLLARGLSPTPRRDDRKQQPAERPGKPGPLTPRG